MKIEELLYKTPEMTEERLLKIIVSHVSTIKSDIRDRIKELHKEISLEQAFLNEYDLIQNRKSNLTKSQRDFVLGFVGMCMIRMTKNNELVKT